MTVLEARMALVRVSPRDLMEMTKPRITLLIVLTALLGFVLAGGTFGLTAIALLAGTALVSSGSSALNQVLERESDASMRRTENRPLPAGRLRPAEALFWGLLLSVGGLLILALSVNLLTAALAGLTLVTYGFVYTPMKKVSSLATIVGAIPGALPPVGGWAAATGTLASPALILFAIVFLWQMPHFLAIACLYRDDYRRGGMPMLPVVDADGRFTALQVLIYNAALLPVSLLPSALGMAGGSYLTGAVLLGLGLNVAGFLFARRRTQEAARRLLLASVIYLPLLWGLLLMDRTGA
ncbi:MAG: heme o synthase [Acidobacteria bacterium]|nr:heme o synthase [Acidobacteriota bacterium]